jgi:hypothetical protein
MVWVGELGRNTYIEHIHACIHTYIHGHMHTNIYIMHVCVCAYT